LAHLWENRMLKASIESLHNHSNEIENRIVFRDDVKIFLHYERPGLGHGTWVFKSYDDGDMNSYKDSVSSCGIRNLDIVRKHLCSEN